MENGLLYLPQSVNIEGKDYRINTDFKIWIEIEHLFFDNNMSDAEKLAKILALAYPVLPHNPFEAVSKLLWFYSGSEEKEKKTEDLGIGPVYDIKKDFGYIWAAFKADFGIDLCECDMHWHKFKILFSCLSEESRFSKIVGYRSIDTSGIKDKEARRYYEKMKKRFSLLEDDKDHEKQLVRSLEGIF